LIDILPWSFCMASSAMVSHACGCRILSGLVALMALVGCGKVPQEVVSGTVTFSGKPLPNGLVSFIADGEGGAVAAGEISDGRYSVAIPPGNYRITVVSIDSGGPAPEGVPDASGPSARRVKSIPIPQRYGEFGASGLRVTVATGPMTHDIALTP